MPFWTEKREAGTWDFKGKLGNSQIDTIEHVVNNNKTKQNKKAHAGPPRNNWTQGNIKLFLGPSLFFITNMSHGEYAKIFVSKQIFLSKFFRQAKEEN